MGSNSQSQVLPRNFATKTKGSQVWRGIKKWKENFNLGASFEARNRRDTEFWPSKWINDRPLYARYPNLFIVASDPEILVSNVFVNGLFSLAFLGNLYESNCFLTSITRAARRFLLTHGKRFNEMGLGDVGRLHSEIYLRQTDPRP